MTPQLFGTGDGLGRAVGDWRHEMNSEECFVSGECMVMDTRWLRHRCVRMFMLRADCCCRNYIGQEKRRDGNALGGRMAMSRDVGCSETAGGLAVYVVMAGTIMEYRRCRREGLEEAAIIVMEARARA